MRRLKIDLLVSEADRRWLGEQLAGGQSTVILAAALRRMGYGSITSRDVFGFRESKMGSPQERYLRAIEQMHEFCAERGRPFKEAMVQAIETFMAGQKDEGRGMKEQ